MNKSCDNCIYSDQPVTSAECGSCGIDRNNYMPKLNSEEINRLEAKIKELKSEVLILTDANKNLQELYQEEKEIAETAKQKAINICKKLTTGTGTDKSKPISRAVYSEWYLNYDYLFNELISLYKGSKGDAHQAYSEVIDIIFRMVISTINTEKSKEAD